MNTMPSTETVSGRIEQFRKLTATLATFRVNGAPCKAEHLAVARIESWSKKLDCVYEFHGAYQQSRFGREFVVVHGRPKALGASSISPQTNKEVDAIMIKIEKSPRQHEAATTLPATEATPAEAPSGGSNS